MESADADPVDSNANTLSPSDPIPQSESSSTSHSIDAQTEQSVPSEGAKVPDPDHTTSASNIEAEQVDRTPTDSGHPDSNLDADPDPDANTKTKTPTATHSTLTDTDSVPQPMSEGDSNDDGDGENGADTMDTADSDHLTTSTATAVDTETESKADPSTTSQTITTPTNDVKSVTATATAATATATATGAATAMSLMNPMMAMTGMLGMPPPGMIPGFPPFPILAPFAPGMMPLIPGITPPVATPQDPNQPKAGKRCGDWQSYITSKDKTYFFNVVTKVTTWDRPENWKDDDDDENNTKDNKGSTETANSSSDGVNVNAESDGNGMNNVVTDCNAETLSSISSMTGNALLKNSILNPFTSIPVPTLNPNPTASTMNGSLTVTNSNGTTSTATTNGNDDSGKSSKDDDSSTAKTQSVNRKRDPLYLGTSATKQLNVVSDSVAARSFGMKCKSEYKDRSQRIAAFRALLSDKRIDCGWSWKKVLPKIVSDKRYNALKKLEDKKEELVNWQHDERLRLQEEEREHRNRLKSDYFALLDSFTDKIVKRDFRKARHYIESDDRFLNIERKHRREDWFEEWQKTAYKEYKKRRKRIKEAALCDFESRLRDSGLVTLDSDWDTVRDAIDFGEEPFMKELSERGQRKVYEEVVAELEEEEQRKEEEAKTLRKKVHKIQRVAFGQFIDELVAERKLCARSKWLDVTVQTLLSESGDARYQQMVETQKHRMGSVFMERMEALKKRLADSKRVFKQFMKTLKGTSSELVVAEGDSLEMVSVRFKALLEGQSAMEEGKGSEGGGNGKLEEMKKVSGDDVELLLMEYMMKKRKQNKEGLGKKTNRGQDKMNGTESKTSHNHKKRGRSRHEEEKELSPESGAEPQRKRQKIDHNPSEQNEAMELEEGELSEEEEANYKTSDRVQAPRGANGHRSERNGRSGSSCLSQSSEDPHDAMRDSPSPSRSRSRSNGKHGRRRRKEKKDGSSRRRERRNGTRERASYGDIVYGIGSDLDEDDLYYKGGVKEHREHSEGTDDMDGSRRRNGDRMRGKMRLKNRRDLDISLEEMSARRGGGGGGVWRRELQRHRDLDRVDYPTEQDTQIDANSYNLDQ